MDWVAAKVLTAALGAHPQDGQLMRLCALQRLHHEPGALVVLYVSANLADHRRVAKAVQVIVLDLRSSTTPPFIKIRRQIPHYKGCR